MPLKREPNRTDSPSPPPPLPPATYRDRACLRWGLESITDLLPHEIMSEPAWNSVPARRCVFQNLDCLSMAVPDVEEARVLLTQVIDEYIEREDRTLHYRPKRFLNEPIIQSALGKAREENARAWRQAASTRWANNAQRPREATAKSERPTTSAENTINEPNSSLTLHSPPTTPSVVGILGRASGIKRRRQSLKEETSEASTVIARHLSALNSQLQSVSEKISQAESRLSARGRTSGATDELVAVDKELDYFLGVTRSWSENFKWTGGQEWTGSEMVDNVASWAADGVKMLKMAPGGGGLKKEIASRHERAAELERETVAAEVEISVLKARYMETEKEIQGLREGTGGS